MKENNILLAEFLGWVEQTDPTEKWFGGFRDLKGTVHRNTDKEPLLFHSDWNWLMLVVEKIETMPIEPEFFIMYDSREDFKGWYWNVSVRKLFNKDCLNREPTKIEAYYNACIEFVKWYNKQ